MGLLDIIIIILIVGWLGGFSMHVGGNLIHLVLVIAIIIIIARFLGFNL